MFLVRKFFTYFFIIAYLFSFPEMRQVIKLPNLVEHYISHKLRDENTTLFSFIKMHYLDEQIKDSDYSQDMKLPFKTHDISVVAFNLVYPPKKIEFNFEHKPLDIDEQHQFTYTESFYPSVFQKIWQPPKI